MTPSILAWLGGAVREEFARRRPARVLEVGSLNVNGSARDVLRLFAGEWLGIDRQAGPGVDWVGEITQLREEGAWADAIVCTEALEHDKFFWQTLRYMTELSRPGALWVITTPANGFPEHRHPCDYYRFMPDAYRDVFFAGAKEILCVEYITPPLDGNSWEIALGGMAVMP